MPDVCHMDTYLVGPACFEVQHHECKAVESLYDFIFGDGFPFGVISDGHLLAVALVPADRQVDRPVVELDDAFDQGQIILFYRVVLELPGKFPMAPAGFRYDHHARSILIEAMDYAGPRRIHIGKVSAMVQERIDYRPGLCARSGMDGYPRLFVYHHYVVVFI